VDVAAKNLNRDLEIRFLPVASPEVAERGVKKAPALVINRKYVVEGAPTVEEIAELIERARPIRVGLILTRPPVSEEDAENALQTGLSSLATGDEVDLFLLSDGVWAARKGLGGRVGELLTAFQSAGGRVHVSGEHLRAGGLAAEQLRPGVEIAPDGLDRLVDLVMEEWDRVVVL
jgi:sulfur relay (sulfurtransferase) complex TusBCD TusD component (DsrE family)